MNFSIRKIVSFVAERAERIRNDLAQSAKDANERMMDAAENGPRRGTRWGRGLIAFLPATLVSGYLGGAIIQGVIAANFTIGAQPLDLTLKRADADGLTLVIAQSDMRNPDGTTAPTPLVKASIGTANAIDGLCAIVKQEILGQSVSLVINAAATGTAGGSGVDFLVTELQAGETELQNVQLGRSADEISMNGVSVGGQPGGFGIDGSQGHAVLNDVTGKAVGASIMGGLKAPDFGAALVRGDAKC